jgi:exosortase
MFRKLPGPLVISVLVLASCLGWALWPVLVSMTGRWNSDPRYAHGSLVPIFALALLWMRPSGMGGSKISGSSWGLVLVGLATAVQLVGGYFRVGAVEGFALLPYLAGFSLLIGGWPALKWSWPSIGFLAFMMPLPWRVENALGLPLQWVATTVSTYLLQTLGFMAFAEGNVIELNNAKIGVVEACSGLSMLMTFIALSTAVALVVKRPLLDRIVLVASAIPVALLANIIRITVTGILHDTVGGRMADSFYHDLAGWLMIPLALVLYWLEIWILSRILIETKHETSAVIDVLESYRSVGRTTTRKVSTV